MAAMWQNYAIAMFVAFNQYLCSALLRRPGGRRIRVRKPKKKVQQKGSLLILWSAVVSAPLFRPSYAARSKQKRKKQRRGSAAWQHWRYGSLHEWNNQKVPADPCRISVCSPSYHQPLETTFGRLQKATNRWLGLLRLLQWGELYLLSCPNGLDRWRQKQKVTRFYRQRSQIWIWLQMEADS